MTEKESASRAAYLIALKKFDAAICEATAVSQATANRLVSPNVGYASKVFTRMCGAGITLIRAAPLSRWTHSDFEDWQFTAVAAHVRSLLDGYLLFKYLIESPGSDAEWAARITVMDINDCTRRIEMHTNIGSTENIVAFEKQRVELQERLKGNEFFATLPAPVRKQCLNGHFIMMYNRDAMLVKVGLEKGQFDALYDLLSQHIHILPMSFYRMASSGRGTGLENDTDRSYIAGALVMAAMLLAEATDCMVGRFPEAAKSRKGTDSIFSPGPASNGPKKAKLAKKNGGEPIAKSRLAAAVKETLKR